MVSTRERCLLAELEIAGTGGTHRLFKIYLEDGTTILASFQSVNFHGFNPIPTSPSATQIHEAISTLASAHALQH